VLDIDNVAERIYVEPERRKMLIDLALNTDGFIKAENQYRKKDGTLFWGQLYFRVVRDSDGEAKHLEGFVEDITERKQAQEALRTSEERYRAVFDNAGIGISLRDRDGRFVQVNSAMMDMLGYSDMDFHHLTPTDITHFDDRDISKWIFESIMRGEISTYRLEKRYIRKDGRTMWGDVSVSAIRNENGDHIATVGVIADITDRKLADDKLRASLREKEILLREIHHRVKNNLQLITSLLRLQLRQIKGEDESLVEIFEDIQSRIKTIALVHQSLYRSEELDLIDISQYMQRILGSLRASSARSTREVSIKADVKNILLRIDAALACGLIVNELVTNSLKHAFPEGREGEIVVTLKSVGGKEFQLTVHDNGIGIPEQIDLQQLESLGLDLVANLVRQLNGTIELATGEGTEFRIRFEGQNSRSGGH